MATQYQQHKPFAKGKLILIAIVLLALAAFVMWPSQNEYDKRVYVAEGLHLTSFPKLAIEEYYAKHKTFPINNAAAGLAEGANMQGKGTTRIDVSTTGSGTGLKALIMITFNNKLEEGKTLVLSAEIPKDGKTISWDCKGGTVKASYRPAECR